MGKANDKKVAREARALLLRTIGNLLESHRERRFTYSTKAKPLTRKLFCNKNNLQEGTVACIETGRFLDFTFPQLRLYLATTYGRDDEKFKTSAKKVYDGVKELDNFLTML